MKKSLTELWKQQGTHLRVLAQLSGKNANLRFGGMCPVTSILKAYGSILETAYFRMIHTPIYIYILQFIICDFTMVFPYSSSICSWLLRVFVSHASEVKVFPRSSLSGI